MLYLILMESQFNTGTLFIKCFIKNYLLILFIYKFINISFINFLIKSYLLSSLQNTFIQYS